MAWSGSGCWSGFSPGAAAVRNHGAVRGIAAGLRSRASDFVSSPARRAQDLSLVEAGFLRRTGISLHVVRTGGRDRPRAARQVRNSRAASARLRPPGAGDRLLSLRAADTGQRSAGLLRLSHASRISKPSAAPARPRKTGVVIGGGLLGLEAAKALKDLGLETHVVEFAPRLMAVQIDDGGGRVLRSEIGSLGVRCHTGKSRRRDRRRRRAPLHCTEIRRRQRTRDGHDRVLGRHPAARRAARAARACASGSAAASSSTTPAAPPTRTSTPSANARCGAARSTAWWRPATRWRSIAAAQLQGDAQARFTGADMSTKLKLMGVDVASHRRCARRTRRAPRLLIHRRAQAALQEAGGQRGRQASARRRAGRRRRGLRHLAADDAERPAAAGAARRN